MKLTWIGHSCFKIEKNGFAVVTDPYQPDYVPGLTPVEETANLVLCSHEHKDHGYKEAVAIEKTDATAPEITEIASWHDDAQGALRGANRMYVIDFGDERVAHLGDLGCELDEEQLAQLKNPDVLLIPVGGHFTIDAQQAAAITKQLAPKLAIPMHYRDDALHIGYDIIGTVDAYTDAMGVEFAQVGSVLETTTAKAKVAVMRPKNC